MALEDIAKICMKDYHCKLDFIKLQSAKMSDILNIKNLEDYANDEN